MTSLAAYQSTLFGQGPAAIRTPAAVRRVRLDEHSWIDLSRDWLAGSDELFTELLDTLEWRGRRRPMYGALIDEPRLTAPLDPAAPAANRVFPEIIAWLEERYGESLGSVWVNHYRDGRDSVAWHSDRIGRTQVDPLVAIVSLGGPRRFHLRPTGGGPSVRLRLASGDLLVMGGACQHRWEHTVPKSACSPPRMSVTFRSHRSEDPDI